MYNIPNSREILEDFFNNFSNFQDFDPTILYSESEYIALSLKKQNRKIFKEFNQKYPKFFIKLAEMFYAAHIGNIEEIIKLKFCCCGVGLTKFYGYVKGYTTYCSAMCAARNPLTKSKKKQTKLEHYGDENYTNVEKMKRTKLEKYGDENYVNVVKRMKTKLEKYGDENYNNTEKQKKTCLEKYGETSYMKTAEYLEKKKKTCLEKYGHEHASLSKDVIEKKKKTCLKKYGVDHYSKTDEYQEKCKATYKQRYGVDHYSKTDEYKEKSKKTCLEKYGVDHYSKTDEYKNRFKKTFFERYGGFSSFDVPAIREKIRLSNIERYGFENPSKNEEVKSKIRATNRERYGADIFSKSHIQNLDDLNEEFIRSNFIKDGYFLPDEFCEYFNASLTLAKVIRYKFNILENKRRERNKTQNSIFEWIQQFSESATNNTRMIISKELDIFLPNEMLAIEYDGLIYHSFGKSSWKVINNADEEPIKKYEHLNKTEECLEKGIQLLHIFEDEWNDNEDVWKSVILSKLGFNDRIYGRKCEIKKISYQESNEFLQINHLQGNSSSSIQLGLFHQGELVSVMTFGKSRYNNKYQYELIRFCSLMGLTVVGGASKLFQYFVRNYNPDSVISYANRRWSDGNLYRKMGFTELGTTEPNYFYFNKYDEELQSRIKFQKHKLKDLLPVYNEELTETQNMYENGYRKIYDCGNYVFAWDKTK